MSSSINNNNNARDLFDYLKNVGLGGVAGGAAQPAGGRGRSANPINDNDFQDVIDVEITEEERLYTQADRNARREAQRNAEETAAETEADAPLAGGVIPLDRSFGAYNATYDAAANTGYRQSGFAGNVYPPSPSPESAIDAYLGNTPEGLAAPFQNRLNVVA